MTTYFQLLHFILLLMKKLLHYLFLLIFITKFAYSRLDVRSFDRIISTYGIMELEK